MGRRHRKSTTRRKAPTRKTHYRHHRTGSIVNGQPSNMYLADMVKTRALHARAKTAMTKGIFKQADPTGVRKLAVMPKILPIRDGRPDPGRLEAFKKIFAPKTSGFGYPWMLRQF